MFTFSLQIIPVAILNPFRYENSMNASAANSINFIHPDKGLVLHQVSKRFGSVRTLDQLPINVAPNEGKIIQVDTPQNIRENPVDDFVTDFMDCFELQKEGKGRIIYCKEALLHEQ